MPPSPMNYGMVMRAVESRQVLLDTDPLNRTQNDTQRIYPTASDWKTGGRGAAR
jgi:hypothetical protein